MSDTSLNKIIQYGTTAQRVAFVPAPPAAIQTLYIWYDTDNAPNTYIWNGAAWVQINSGAGSLAASRLLGRGSAAGAGSPVPISLGAGLTMTGTVLSASSAGAGWTFIATAAASGAAVDFTGLAAFNEILVILKGVTATGACIRQLLVSTDNGVSFKNASGDYVTIDSNGASTNATSLSFDNGNNATAHDGWIQISLFNDTNSALKPANSCFPTTNTVGAVNLALALNAIRVRPHTNAFNGGNIYVFGK